MSKIYSQSFVNTKIAALAVFMLVLFNLNASSQVLSFKTFSLESGTALSQGAVYRFSNVCPQGNVDALVTVSELHRVLLVHVDSMFTGTDDGFQPLISSTGGKGDHYVVFNITFVTGGTVVPLDIVNFSGTFYDLNGNNQINEYVSTTMESSTWAYSSSNPAITVSQASNTITGVSANKNFGQAIDTANKNNSFVVNTASLNSLSVKFGFTQETTGWNGNDQFSLLFSGRSSATTTMDVRLQNFSLRENGEKIELMWSTAGEDNFSHFVVERSINGKDFSEVGIVFSAQNINSTYKYSDAIKSGDIVYYRLKMVDKNQTFETSAIRIYRNLKEAKGATIMAYPNPVSNELRISVPSSWQGKPVNYTLYATDGSVKKHIVRSANQTEVFSMRGFDPGVYIVKVNSGNEMVVKQIIKL